MIRTPRHRLTPPERRSITLNHDTMQVRQCLASAPAPA
jgi:hypothetical protein